ncbi:MAG: hypothetical protein E7497_08000 [Ruminococcus sp.]|nr:hypothetical protein [Ruminococcus sp.]
MKYGKITAILLSAAMVSGTYASQWVSAESGDTLTMEDIIVEDDNGGITSNIITAYENNNNSHGVNNSYLYQDDDGWYHVVSAAEESLLVANYRSDLSYAITYELSLELPVWGGFYCGEEYNYCLFGQSNSEENDNAEVIRVVKYDKLWRRIGSASIYGSNTVMPFYAGTPRMYEKDGMLYVHTSHLMYTSDDGLNHQANHQIHIDADTMDVVYNYGDVMNINYGYVSHSFDQYVRADENYVYTADLGDAYPRSVAVCRKMKNGIMKDYNKALPIYGSIGNNYTGVSLGGFELSDDKCIVIGNSVVQNEANFNTDVRNIFITLTDKDMSSSELIWLTDYDDINRVSRPKLVKIDDNTFIGMWNEYEVSESDGWFNLVENEGSNCRIVKFNADGEILEDITNDARISDCDPIVVGDEIIWYMTEDNGKTTFFHMEYDNLTQYDGLEYTFDAAERLGDVDNDDAVNSSDASMVLTEYALTATGHTPTFDKNETLAADVNEDGSVDSSDASTILSYYAYTATGGTESLLDYLG